MFMVLAIGEIIGPSFPYRLGGGVPTATAIAMASLAVAFCPFTLGVVYAFLLTLGVAMTCAWTALYDFKQRVKETDPRDAAAWEATVGTAATTHARSSAGVGARASLAAAAAAAGRPSKGHTVSSRRPVSPPKN